jgi:hypothetical protein
VTFPEERNGIADLFFPGASLYGGVMRRMNLLILPGSTTKIIEKPRGLT